MSRRDYDEYSSGRRTEDDDDSRRDSRYYDDYNRDSNCKVYVGSLSKDCKENDLYRHFGYYGSLRNVWVARNPPGFAFIEFVDSKDAEDAIRGLDGLSVCGSRIRVEHCSGRKRVKPWTRGGHGRGGRLRTKAYNPEDRCYKCDKKGHYAYDCHKYSRKRKRSCSRSRSRSRSPKRYGSERRHERKHSRSSSRSKSPQRPMD